MEVHGLNVVCLRSCASTFSIRLSLLSQMLDIAHERHVGSYLPIYTCEQGGNTRVMLRGG